MKVEGRGQDPRLCRRGEGPQRPAAGISGVSADEFEARDGVGAVLKTAVPPRKWKGCIDTRWVTIVASRANCARPDCRGSSLPLPLYLAGSVTKPGSSDCARRGHDWETPRNRSRSHLCGRKVGVQGLIRPEVSFSVKTVARPVGKSDRSPIRAWKTGPGAPFPPWKGVVKSLAVSVHVLWNKKRMRNHTKRGKEGGPIQRAGSFWAARWVPPFSSWGFSFFAARAVKKGKSG